MISRKLLCTLRHGYSPVNLLHIFRTPLNTSGWLLLVYLRSHQEKTIDTENNTRRFRNVEQFTRSVKCTEQPEVDTGYFRDRFTDFGHTNLGVPKFNLE